jgi:hypothetical protein
MLYNIFELFLTGISLWKSIATISIALYITISLVI